MFAPVSVRAHFLDNVRGGAGFESASQNLPVVSVLSAAPFSVPLSLFLRGPSGRVGVGPVPRLSEMQAALISFLWNLNNSKTESMVFLQSHVNSSLESLPAYPR